VLAGFFPFLSPFPSLLFRLLRVMKSLCFKTIFLYILFFRSDFEITSSVLEVIGTVENETVINCAIASNFSENFDMEQYNNLLGFTQKFPDMFYGAEED
jgi:hypothetical protein